MKQTIKEKKERKTKIKTWTKKKVTANYSDRMKAK